MKPIVLGPQASRLPASSLTKNNYLQPLDETELVLYDVGRRGRLRSQHDRLPDFALLGRPGLANQLCHLRRSECNVLF